MTLVGVQASDGNFEELSDSPLQNLVDTTPFASWLQGNTSAISAAGLRFKQISDFSGS